MADLYNYCSEWIWIKGAKYIKLMKILCIHYEVIILVLLFFVENLKYHLHRPLC